jgi:hypothetical protein
MQRQIPALAMAVNIALAACVLAQAVGEGRPGWERIFAAERAPEDILAHRRVTATRLRGARPQIDGRLDDGAWCEPPAAAGSTGSFIATYLIQTAPLPGAPASLVTEARILYDDQALYVAVRLFDPAPGLILAPLLRRDDEGQSDWVFVEFDSRRDRRTAFSFGLNPRGVQVDGQFSNDRVYDPAWDGVWEAAARIDSLGWTAEFRIPFSQLPHDDSSDVWGFNIYRTTPHQGETSNWSPRLPSLAGVVSHFNDLVFKDLPRSRRPVEVVPYLAARAGNRAADVGPGRFAGLDVKARLRPELQLNLALHPDFGQVEADPSLVNLTAFQTFFPERRSLFVQGADAFSFGQPFVFATRDLSFGDDAAFYSRRIGRAPQGTVPVGFDVVERPGASSIIAAAKLSGRCGPWTLGLLDAWTGSESARGTDFSGATSSIPVEPTTNYAIVRAVRDWRAGESAAGIIASLVQRVGMAPLLAGQLQRSALVMGLDGRHRFGGGRYEAAGALLGSRLTGDPAAIVALLAAPEHNVYRPDAGYLARLRANTTGRPVTGILADARLAKVGGGAWTWNVTGHLISPGFDLNDGGFLRSADWLLATGSFQYQRFFPTSRIVQRLSIGSSQSGFGWNFGGERRAAVLNGFVSADFANFWDGKLAITQDLSSLATEYLRGGPALLLPPRTRLTALIDSDQRRGTLFQLQVSATREPGTGSASWSVAPGIVANLSPAVGLAITPSVGRASEGWQFVAQAKDGAETTRTVVGRLTEPTVALTLRATVGLSSRLSFQLYAQPFLSTGRFDRFGEVAAPRAPRPESRIAWIDAARLGYDASTGQFAVDAENPASAFRFNDPNFSQRDFNANLVVRWEFRPGSTLFMIWTHRRHDGLYRDFDLLRDAGRIFCAPPANVFLAKVSYWLSW